MVSPALDVIILRSQTCKLDPCFIMKPSLPLLHEQIGYYESNLSSYRLKRVPFLLWTDCIQWILREIIERRAGIVHIVHSEWYLTESATN